MRFFECAACIKGVRSGSASSFLRARYIFAEEIISTRKSVNFFCALSSVSLQKSKTGERVSAVFCVNREEASGKAQRRASAARRETPSEEKSKKIVPLCIEPLGVSCLGVFGSKTFDGGLLLAEMQ